MGKLTTTNSINTSGTTSGVTNINSYTFIDNYGNVTQISKKSKSRLKYYIDDKLPQPVPPIIYVIGISGSDSGVTFGIGLGLGDNTYGLANY